jgi:hypothetical protein
MKREIMLFKTLVIIVTGTDLERIADKAVIQEEISIR